MALRELCGKCESRADVGFFKIGKVLKQLFHCATGCQGLNHHSHSHTHTPNAGLSAHYFGIDCNALDSLHVHIVAQMMIVPAVDNVGEYTRHFGLAQARNAPKSCAARIAEITAASLLRAWRRSAACGFPDRLAPLTGRLAQSDGRSKRRHSAACGSLCIPGNCGRAPG